jgi:2-amino-4-hydroxy-6-hydroxymethyldihydropteridine diphosphokinase
MIYLALGSNLRGDFASSVQLVQAAIDNLPLTGAHVVQRAPLYASAPIGPAGQDDYINTVVAVRSVVPALALLPRLHALEAAFGRHRGSGEGVVWGPRTLDIDIISYHDEVHRFRAQIPHPRAPARAFVLRPLADIAPGWRHPEYGTPIGALLAALPMSARVGLKRL